MMDNVNHPPHYQMTGGIEAIEVIERYGLFGILGTAMKYLLRAGKKGDLVEDLRKAEWYLARWVALDIACDVADEDALEWHTPEAIAEAAGATGPRARAIILVLESAAFDSAGGVKDHEMIPLAIEQVQQAIAEAAAVVGSASP